MAKPNYQYEKRQRDLAKKQKQEEKRRQKLANKDAPDAGQDAPDESASGDANTIVPSSGETSSGT